VCASQPGCRRRDEWALCTIRWWQPDTNVTKVLIAIVDINGFVAEVHCHARSLTLTFMRTRRSQPLLSHRRIRPET
jgi:hypothetical protein